MSLPPAICALLLAAAAIVAAFIAPHPPSATRDYLRFAASLYASLSLAELIATADAAPDAQLAADCVALLVMTLAPQALALALAARFGRKPGSLSAISLLLAGCAGGVAAAATGSPGVAIAGSLVALSIMLASALRARRAEAARATHAILSAVALFAGAAALMSRNAANLSALALFSAAGLTGVAWVCTSPSNVAVERAALTRGSASGIRRTC